MPSVFSLTAHQPQPPFPPHPGFDPHLPHVRVVPPVVYVEPTFEYKQLTRAIAGAAPVTEDELNELGKVGWELVSILNDGQTAHFYFKRVAR